MKRLKRKLSSLVLRVKRWLIEKLGGQLCSRSCDLFTSRIEVVERLLPNPKRLRSNIVLFGKPMSFGHDQEEIRRQMAKRMVKTLMESGDLEVKTNYDPIRQETTYMGELLVFPMSKEEME